MSQISLMLKDHSVPIEPSGGTASVTVGHSGGTVFYADNPQVSAAQNQGSIPPGGSQTFTSNAWMMTPGVADVLVSVTSIYDEWAAVSPLTVGQGGAGGGVTTGQAIAMAVALGG